MAFAVHKLNRSFAAAGVGFSALLSGCVTSPLLPSVTNINEVNPDNCTITDARIFRRGSLIATFLPFIPNNTNSDTTQIDENCVEGRIVNGFLLSNSFEKELVGMGMVDELGEREQTRINQQLVLNGTSIEALRARLPQIVDQQVNDNCAQIRYRTTNGDQERVFMVLKCADTVPATSFLQPRTP